RKHGCHLVEFRRQPGGPQKAPVSPEPDQLDRVDRVVLRESVDIVLPPIGRAAETVNEDDGSAAALLSKPERIRRNVGMMKLHRALPIHRSSQQVRFEWSSWI